MWLEVGRESRLSETMFQMRALLFERRWTARGWPQAAGLQLESLKSFVSWHVEDVAA